MKKLDISQTHTLYCD